MAFEIRFTGDFLRECVFNSRTSALDQARRLTRLARLLAICPSPAAAAATRPSIAERMRDEKQPDPAAGSSIYAWPWFAAMCTPAPIKPEAPSACLRRGLNRRKNRSVAYSIGNRALYDKSDCNNSEEGLRQARKSKQQRAPRGSGDGECLKSIRWRLSHGPDWRSIQAGGRRAAFRNLSGRPRSHPCTGA